MKYLKKNQNGFGLVDVLFVLLVIIVLGIVSYVVIKHRHTIVRPITSAVTSSQQQRQFPYLSQDHINALVAADTTSWPTFTKQDAWFSFAYPGTWSMDNSLGAYKAHPNGKTFDEDTVDITSPDGDKKVDYSLSVQPNGSQIKVDVLYTSAGIQSPINDCAKDRPYRLLAQIPGSDGINRCLYDNASDHRSYQVEFDAQNSQVLVTASFGNNITQNGIDDTLSNLIGIAKSIKVTSKPS